MIVYYENNLAMTITQAAERLQVHPNTIRRQIDKGQIPAIRIGRLIRIPAEIIENMLNPRTVVANEQGGPNCYVARSFKK